MLKTKKEYKPHEYLLNDAIESQEDGRCKWKTIKSNVRVPSEWRSICSRYRAATFWFAEISSCRNPWCKLSFRASRRAVSFPHYLRDAAISRQPTEHPSRHRAAFFKVRFLGTTRDIKRTRGNAIRSPVASIPKDVFEAGEKPDAALFATEFSSTR